MIFHDTQYKIVYPVRPVFVSVSGIVSIYFKVSMTEVVQSKEVFSQGVRQQSLTQ